jgi:hemerythrin-like domain-containing protein
MGMFTQGAAKIMGAVKHLAAATTGQTGILATLSKEHGQVSVLLKRLKTMPARSSNERDALFQEIRTELLAHAAAEERVFYAELRKHAETREKVQHSKKEHDEIEQVLETLNNSTLSGAAWTSSVDRLVERVEHHVEEEEGEVFPKAKKALSHGDLDRLDKVFKRQKKQELDKRPQ